MYAPRVFISMSMVLIVFAVSSYLISGSAYTAFVQTLICAVLLQAGYFIGVLYLVRRERKLRQKRASGEVVAAKNRDVTRRESLRADTAGNLSAGDS